MKNKVHKDHRSSALLNSKLLTDTGHFQKCLPYEILGGKTVKNVQIDPQTKKL